MTKDELEEDWLQYANAGFGSTDYSLWDEGAGDQTAEQNVLPEQLETGDEEIPSAPKPGGIKHLVRIGSCETCLGRLSGKMRHGQEMKDCGVELLNEVLEHDMELSAQRDAIEMCPFCEDLFEEIDLLTSLIDESCQPYEYQRLQLGIKMPKDQIEQEEYLRKRFGAGGSPAIKQSIVERISKNLIESKPSIKIVSEKPEIMALIDVLTLNVELDIRSHYLYGRYRKLEREIPQTRWPCRVCKERGCEKCNGTGQQYPHSVQSLIGDPLIEIYDSTEHAFHGMGREDIDVRCLGRGRPFVIELKNPKKRTFDLDLIEKIINEKAEGAIEVNSVRISNRNEVVRIKDTPAEKSYTIRFLISELEASEYEILTKKLDPPKPSGRGRRRQQKRPAPKEPIHTLESLRDLKKDMLVEICVKQGLPKTGTKAALIERILSPKEKTFLSLPELNQITDIMANFSGQTLEQRTPKRVAHRRADLIRKKKVIETYDFHAELNELNQIEGQMSLRCESGTYVKEAIHGDGGYTQPSISSLLKAKCDVIWLDVAEIHSD